MLLYNFTRGSLRGMCPLLHQLKLLNQSFALSVILWTNISNQICDFYFLGMCSLSGQSEQVSHT